MPATGYAAGYGKELQQNGHRVESLCLEGMMSPLDRVQGHGFGFSPIERVSSPFVVGHKITKSCSGEVCLLQNVKKSVHKWCDVCGACVCVCLCVYVEPPRSRMY